MERRGLGHTRGHLTEKTGRTRERRGVTTIVGVVKRARYSYEM